MGKLCQILSELSLWAEQERKFLTKQELEFLSAKTEMTAIGSTCMELQNGFSKHVPIYELEEIISKWNKK